MRGARVWRAAGGTRNHDRNNGGPVGPSEKAPVEPSQRPGAGASRWLGSSPISRPRLKSPPERGVFQSGTPGLEPTPVTQGVAGIQRRVGPRRQRGALSGAGPADRAAGCGSSPRRMGPESPSAGGWCGSDPPRSRRAWPGSSVAWVRGDSAGRCRERDRQTAQRDAVRVPDRVVRESPSAGGWWDPNPPRSRRAWPGSSVARNRPTAPRDADRGPRPGRRGCQAADGPPAPTNPSRVADVF